ncbi:MAG TPA: hypothetical protein VLF61_01985 [Rhabdochlamydiaceae bacterium]|nr:hypothetical protein [Rhabdochlamydiaceae bacterium]
MSLGLFDNSNLNPGPVIPVSSLAAPAPARAAGVTARVRTAIHDSAQSAWNGVLNFANRTFHLLAGQMGDAGQEALQALKKSATQTPNPSLDSLYQELSHLKEHRFYSPLQKAHLVEQLQKFNAQFEQILAGAAEADHSPATLTGPQKEAIEQLCDALVRNQPIQEETLNAVYSIIAHFRELQMGLVQMTTEALKVNALDWVKKSIGLSERPDSSELRRQIDESRRLRAELQKRTILAEVENQVPPKIIDAIRDKCAFFSTLAANMALAKIIFPEEEISTLFPLLWDLAQRSNITFREAIQMQFGNHTSIFRRIVVFFHLYLTAPILEFYISESVKKVEKDLITFLNKSPNARVEDLFFLGVKPLRAHLTTFESQLTNLDASHTVLQTSIEEYIENYFDTFNLNGKINAARVDELARILIERYIPVFSLSAPFEKILNVVFPNTNYRIIDAVFGAAKKGLSGVIYISTLPIDWIANRLIKKIVQIILRKWTLPALYEMTQNALEIGTTFQHLINEFIKEKLEEFNREFSVNKRHASVSVSHSISHHNLMQGLINQVFKTIQLHQVMNSSVSLHRYLNGKISPEAVKYFASDLIAQGISPTASTELLKFIQYFLQEKILAEFVWYALDNLTLLMQKSSQEISQEANNLVEATLLDAFKMTVAYAVEESVHHALDPSKAINNEIADAIVELRKASNKFIEECQNTSAENFKKAEESWLGLTRTVTQLSFKFSEKKIKPLLFFSNTLAKSFEEATRELSTTINEIRKRATQKNKFERALVILKSKRRDFDQQGLTIEQIEVGIRMLDSAIKDIPGAEFDKFKKTLQSFLHLASFNRWLSRIPEEDFAKFKQAFDAAIQEAELQIETLTNQMNFAALKAELPQLTHWSAELRAIEVTSEDAGSFQILKQLIGSKAEQYLIDEIIQNGQVLLDIKSKPYHWKGVLWQVIDAYLKKQQV